MKRDELEHNLTNHHPNALQTIRMERIRQCARDLGVAVLVNTPVSREQSLAITNLEQAVMWAVASIAREGDRS